MEHVFLQMTILLAITFSSTIILVRLLTDKTNFGIFKIRHKYWQET